jgi:hypothetical protein
MAGPIQVLNVEERTAFTIPADGAIWWLPPMRFDGNELHFFDRACASLTALVTSAPQGMSAEGTMLIDVAVDGDLAVTGVDVPDEIGPAQAGVAVNPCD